jgi:undecaprenyl-diphosphatase
VDWSVVHALNAALARHDGIEDVTVAYERIAEPLFLAGLVLLLLLAGPTVRRGAVAAGLSAGVALMVAQVISRTANRPRPFVAHPSQVHEFLAHAPDPGFPSDHATAAAAITVALLVRTPRWGLVALGLTLALMVGRVALAIHYPSDVLAGAILGATTAGLLGIGRARLAIDRVADVLEEAAEALFTRARRARG